MIGVDARNSFNQTATMDASPVTPVLECFPTDDTTGVYSGMLYADGHILVKYGWTTTQYKAMVACYD